MNKKLLSFLVFLILLIIGSSCKKTKTNVIYNAEYPNNIGTTWTYKVYDSILNYLDTIKILVVGETEMNNGKKVSIWQIESFYFGTIDSNFVYSGFDGINIYENKLITAPISKHYEFPLVVNKFWIGQYIKDTSIILKVANVTFNNEIFNNAFTIKRQYIAIPNSNFYELELFKPNVGMLSRYTISLNGGYYEKKKWELVRYSIK